jgi:hypothetical protein
MLRIVGSSRHLEPHRIAEKLEGILELDLPGARMQNNYSSHLRVFRSPSLRGSPGV